MKAQALQIIRQAANPIKARLFLREYLQHVILRQLFEMKILQEWVFHGGTALRILYGLNRFSEDLNFHLRQPNENFTLAAMMPKLTRQLSLQGYQISETSTKEKTVRSAFIRFESLLYEGGLSLHKDEKLSIKLEIDANPPPDFQTERSIVNTWFPFAVHHHDPASFLAGKLHAILQRPYTKGRDFYDLIFLLSRFRDIQPNLSYLKNALSQKGYTGEALTENTWRTLMIKMIEKADWAKILADIEPFLESADDLELIDREILIKLLQK
jgi:predicted nucleotidyltransferase component of viral defense system